MDGRKLGIFMGIILVVAGWAHPSLSADLKVGIVDIQRAVNECHAGIEAKKVITKEVDKMQRLYGEKQRELQMMKESFEKQAPMLSQDARANKEKELQHKGREFQRWIEDSQNEINQKRMEIELHISTGLQKVIKKLGEDEGYALILEKHEKIVLFSAKSIDITDRVIKLFNAQKR